jgi:hypothetical protein
MAAGAPGVRSSVRMGSVAARLLVVAASVGLGACSAQMNAQMQTSASAPDTDERRWEVPESAGQATSAPPSSSASPAAAVVRSDTGALPNGELRPLGVAHDLSLSQGAIKGASCTCLAVAFGPPSDPRFVWQAGPPHTSSDVIAVAISGDLDCGWATAKNVRLAKPSIAGIQREGDDVVVTVEGADGGRPVVRGALLVRPAPTSALVVRGKGRVPYGTRADASGGVCRIPMQ